MNTLSIPNWFSEATSISMFYYVCNCIAWEIVKIDLFSHTSTYGISNLGNVERPLEPIDNCFKSKHL